MTTPVVSGLKKKYPDAKIHLLIHEQFKHLCPILENIDHVYCFPYNTIQTSLGERERSLFESYDLVDSLLRTLSAEGYDQVINLTHTKQSGWISSLISSPLKRGLVLDNNNNPHFGSKWFEYLNCFGTRTKENIFHFIDIFFYGAGLRGQRKIRLKETEKGSSEAAQLTLGVSPYIVIQPLTSDIKKNWGLENWSKSLKLISEVEKSRAFVLLGAPNEEKELKVLSEMLHEYKVLHKVIICDLEVAYSILLSADMLITGDTSIKHIASATSIPILEISMGSSSYLRTGAYTHNAVIVQAKELCAPCLHSDLCNYNFACKSRISPECVALTAQSMLQKSESNLKMLASEYVDEIELLRCGFTKDGDWVSYSLSESFSKNSVIKWIDKSSQRFIYNRNEEDELQEFGSEGVSLSEVLSNIFPDRDKLNWIEMYKEIESDCEKFQSEIETVLSEMRVALRNYGQDDSIELLIVRLKKLLANSQYAQEFSTHYQALNDLVNETLKSNSEFYVIKRVREVLAESVKRIQIEIKIVRSLKNQTLEGI